MSEEPAVMVERRADVRPEWQEASSLRSFEGQRVSLALRDGSRIDGCRLVSAGKPGTHTVRLFVDGIEVFLPVAMIVAWGEENEPLRRLVA